MRLSRFVWISSWYVLCLDMLISLLSGVVGERIVFLGCIDLVLSTVRLLVTSECTPLWLLKASKENKCHSFWLERGTYTCVLFVTLYVEKRLNRINWCVKSSFYDTLCDNRDQANRITVKNTWSDRVAIELENLDFLEWGWWHFQRRYL